MSRTEASEKRSPARNDFVFEEGLCAGFRHARRKAFGFLLQHGAAGGCAPNHITGSVTVLKGEGVDHASCQGDSGMFGRKNFVKTFAKVRKRNL